MTDDLERGRNEGEGGGARPGRLAARGGPPVADAGFEVNTDGTLFDLSFFEGGEEAHDHRYGLAIEHLKGSVKGRTYDNEVMRLRVGQGGYYAQSQRFPWAFYGDTARASVSFVSEAEAAAVAWEAAAHYRSGEAGTLLCVYSREEPPDFFLGYRLTEDQRYEIGQLRRSVPVHLRVLFDAAEVVPLVGARSGTLIYQRTRAGKHVLVRAPGRRRPLLAADGEH